MDLPGWLPEWCDDHLGARPAAVLLHVHQVSEVYGLRLEDGREVAVKARPNDDGRAATCVEVQRLVAEQGFPCAAPLTGMTVSQGRAVHAERWRPGGDLDHRDDPATAVRYARLLARLITITADLPIGGTAPGSLEPPLPNPKWVRWDDPVPFRAAVPAVLRDAAARVVARLAVARLPLIVGHADWESQNLRWHGDEPWAVHDWDSLAWLSEAALAGAASGAFASWGQPTLSPIESSAAFLDAYQAARRPFSDEELEVAWAAGLWLGLNNANNEVVGDRPKLVTGVAAEQAAERLRRAGA